MRRSLAGPKNLRATAPNMPEFPFWSAAVVHRGLGHTQSFPQRLHIVALFGAAEAQLPMSEQRGRQVRREIRGGPTLVNGVGRDHDLVSRGRPRAVANPGGLRDCRRGPPLPLAGGANNARKCHMISFSPSHASARSGQLSWTLAACRPIAI